MTITLLIRGASVSAAMRERAEQQSRGFSRYFNGLQTVEWSFTGEAGDVVVSCRLHSRTGFYRASARAATVRAGLDGVVEKLLKQRRRKKAALDRKRRKGARAR